MPDSPRPSCGDRSVSHECITPLPLRHPSALGRPDHRKAVMQAFIGAVSKVRNTKRLSQDSGAMD
jgi:hypothetical protein